jgi:hypothetical protein
MPGTKVTRDQFKLEGDEVVHVPTGARWTAYPGIAEAHSERAAMLGSVLPNGDDYRPEDVRSIAKQILRTRRLEK